ncbi:hypothetical protein FLONG3_1528 [Fusarium longipes]|uniref:Uncharacterized protein n=1 Tax=Fusarium longipes TaxID=694270 RepID=A0A395T7H5_9HYPO|nr:hypothetical protein FLONG3_1528 [Fusarium longipes]
MGFMERLPQEQEPAFWAAVGLGVALFIALFAIGVMATEFHRFRGQRRDHEARINRIVFLQEAYRISESDVSVLQREKYELIRQLNKASEFCLENHCSRHSADSANSSVLDYYIQNEGPHDNEPTSRVASVETVPFKNQVPNLMALANGDATKHVINGEHQVPQQIQFGDLPPVNRIETPARVVVWAPEVEDVAQEDAHARHGQKECVGHLIVPKVSKSRKAKVRGTKNKDSVIE